MSNGVLPADVVLLVVLEVRGDELVDIGQRAHLARRPLDRHRYQRDVRERRLRVGVVASVSGVHLLIHQRVDDRSIIDSRCCLLYTSDAADE